MATAMATAAKKKAASPPAPYGGPAPIASRWRLPAQPRAVVEAAERCDGIRAQCRDLEAKARELKLPLTTLDEVETIDLTIDGADEVDPELNLIKGGGGALLREKVVASITRREVITDQHRVRNQPLLLDHRDVGQRGGTD